MPKSNRENLIGYSKTGAALSFDDFSSVKTFAGLDGIRAICALGVIAEHCQGAVGPLYLKFGFLGVDMFFVISGFLIVTLLLRERDTCQSISLRQFYIRRALRIFPIYYFLLAIVLLFYLAVRPWSPNGLAYYLNCSWVIALYMQDLKLVPLGVFFHTWSLAMEEQFYLFWPLLEKCASPLVRFTLLSLALLLCQASNFGWTNNFVDRTYGIDDAHLHPIFLCTFTPIIFGVTLAHILHQRKTFNILANVCKSPLAIPLLVAIIAASAEMSHHDVQGLPRLVIHVSMTLLLASVVIKPNEIFARILQLKYLASIGRISYGMYLYHVFILTLIVTGLQKVQVTRPSAIEVVILVLPVTLCAASLSYMWIEKPLLNLRSRFSMKSERSL